MGVKQITWLIPESDDFHWHITSAKAPKKSCPLCHGRGFSGRIIVDKKNNNQGLMYPCQCIGQVYKAEKKGIPKLVETV